MRGVGVAATIGGMDVTQWWPRLSPEARDWLVEHNGEPLDPAVAHEILAVNDGVTDPGWWQGDPADGMSELTDDVVDWIEAVANGEGPAGG
ncbi:hypothetical protein GCM10023094_41230 [Rhodococcus olei]|uniref:Uncharacterized protein n=2 Tax=Rhodococcus olei TaxID=2161675 RepID=A0ABP8PGP7_9NOCA